MKHSLDFCQSLEQLTGLKYDDKKYYPNDVEIIEWFHILNLHLFDDKLNMFTEIKVRRLRGAHAYFVYWPYKEKEDTLLEMHRVFKDKKLFVEILAHEMVHHYQHAFDETVGHGRSFYAWRDNFKLKGLTLYKVA